MLRRLDRLHPFQTPDGRRLAVLFAVLYFAQGMWYLPIQTITVVLKERGLSAGAVATFFTITTIPWLVKPVYGMVSDFFPLWRRRRKSYLLLTSALAAAAGLALGMGGEHTYWKMAILFILMGFGLAFTDVVVDALMVENGKPRGLTGAFQAVQWSAIYAASILVGVLGGHLAEGRSLAASFAIAAIFPLGSLAMAAAFVHETPAQVAPEALRLALAQIRAALGDRDVWIVVGFIFFWGFSPSFGPAFLYYQTDVLSFSQQFIGHLAALGSVAAIAGALVYAPLSRQVPLRRLINAFIGLSVASTLLYLGYRGPWSAVVIDTAYGAVYMLTQLAFLDLAAKSCPRRIEATFFALMMSVYNGGTQGSQVVGGYLYDYVGYTALVFISAGFSALAWLLVPLVEIDRIEARARQSATPDAT